MTLLFNEKDHTYSLNGILVPGVTTVLNDEGITNYDAIPEETKEKAFYRGNCVHRAIELDLNGNLDFKNLATDWTPYVEAARKFVSDYDVQPLHIEQLVWSKKRMFAGTLDLDGLVLGKRSIVDWKTGASCWGNCVQTSAYEFAKKECQKMGRTNFKRYAVYLSKEGNYKVEEHKDKNDIHTFMSALTLNTLKRRNGICK